MTNDNNDEMKCAICPTTVTITVPSGDYYHAFLDDSVEFVFCPRCYDWMVFNFMQPEDEDEW